MLSENAVAALRKVAKKSKPAEYNPVTVVEALASLDPAFKIEKTVVGVALAASGMRDVGNYYLGNLVDGSLNVHGAWSKKDPFTVYSPHHGGLTKEGAEALAEKVRAGVMVVGKKMLEKVAEGALYASKIEVGAHDGWRASMEVRVCGLELGVPAWKVTGPGGHEVVLPILPSIRYNTNDLRAGNPNAFTTPTLWTWFYKTYPDMPAQADVAVNSPEVKAAQERKKVLQMVSQHPGHFGTCAVCENVQKLFPGIMMDGHPTMVHHGYERPGYGYIEGDCFAVKMPPYELSSIACAKFAEYLVMRIAEAKADLEEQKVRTTVRGWYGHIETQWDYPKEYVNLTLHLDGRVVTNKDPAVPHDVASKDKSFNGARLLKDTNIAEKVRKEIDADIAAAQKNHDHLVSLRKYMLTKVANWKLQPLPGTSEKDKGDLAASRAGLCPGAGTRDHDYAGRNRMSPWAVCKHCNVRVSITSTGKMRNHMKVGA